MLEVAAALGVAKAAFSTLQRVVEAGQNVESVTMQMAKWYGAVADLREGCRELESPSLWAKATGNPQQMALEAVAARQAEKRMRGEIRTMLMLTHGRTVYLEFVALEKKIIKAREQEEYRKRRARRQMIEAAVGTGVLAVGLAIIAWIASLFVE